MSPIYDHIGGNYTKYRSADRRIAETLVEILDVSPPATIADLGAGTGNYSRAIADLGFQIVAVEPSDVMRRQAVFHRNVRWLEGTAEQIPLPNHSSDAVICILAIHHFSNLSVAIREMARVCESGPIVWFTFDPRLAHSAWLAEYFPSVWNEAFSVFPHLDDKCRQLASGANRQVEATPFLIPHDLQDCFIAAGWRRPEMYLDPDIRSCMSGFTLADCGTVDRGIARLREDLRSGKWKSSYGDLLSLDAVDWGYRFVKAI